MTFQLPELPAYTFPKIVSSELNKSIFENITKNIRQANLSIASQFKGVTFDNPVYRMTSGLDTKKFLWPGIDKSVLAPINSALTAYLKNLPDFASIAKSMRSVFYPPNLRDIPDLKLSDVELVLEEGIPLYHVPSQPIAEKLLRATDARKRREIIGKAFDQIIQDCEEALSGCIHPAFQYEVESTREAISVIRAGHLKAGQALASTVMDSLLWRWGDSNEDDWKLVTRKQRPKKGATARQMEELTVKTHIVMMPAYVAHTSFNPRKSAQHPIPQGFNRHASLHRISFRQYSKRNTAIAMMLATSLLVFMCRHTPIGSSTKRP